MIACVVVSSREVLMALRCFDVDQMVRARTELADQRRSLRTPVSTIEADVEAALDWFPLDETTVKKITKMQARAAW